MGENQRKPTPGAGAQKRPDIVGAVDVTGIEKDGPREAQFLIEREPDFIVQLQESGPTDAFIGDRVPGADFSIFKPPDGVDTAQVEQFVGRHLPPRQLVHPAGPGMQHPDEIPFEGEIPAGSQQYSAQRPYRLPGRPFPRRGCYPNPWWRQTGSPGNPAGSRRRWRWYYGSWKPAADAGRRWATRLLRLTFSKRYIQKRRVYFHFRGWLRRNTPPLLTRVYSLYCLSQLKASMPRLKGPVEEVGLHKGGPEPVGNGADDPLRP